MDNVKETLKILIKGENDAVKLYKAFSQVALDEGYRNISILFDALVMAEKIHIKNHKNALGEDFIPEVDNEIKVSNTVENIRKSLISEVKENRHLYPELIKKIKKECKFEYGKVARLSMIWARDAEKEHAKLLKLAYKSLIKGNDIKFKTIAICQVCGNLVINRIPKKECTVCGHDSIFFESITGGE